jgi:hypothetical protein
MGFMKRDICPEIEIDFLSIVRSNSIAIIMLAIMLVVIASAADTD